MQNQNTSSNSQQQPFNKSATVLSNAITTNTTNANKNQSMEPVLNSSTSNATTNTAVVANSQSKTSNSNSKTPVSNSTPDVQQQQTQSQSVTTDTQAQQPIKIELQITTPSPTPSTPTLPSPVEIASPPALLGPPTTGDMMRCAFVLAFVPLIQVLYAWFILYHDDSSTVSLAYMTILALQLAFAYYWCTTHADSPMLGAYLLNAMWLPYLVF